MSADPAYDEAQAEQPLELADQDLPVPGEATLWAHLIEVHRLHGAALVRHGDSKLSGRGEDLLQEALLVARAKPEQLRHLDLERTCDYLRDVIWKQASHQRERAEHGRCELVEPQELERLAGSDATGASDTGHGLGRAFALLRELKPLEARCVLLKQAGFSTHEAAAELSISTRAARRQLEHGRKRLRALLGAEQIPALLPPALLAGGGSDLSEALARDESLALCHAAWRAGRSAWRAVCPEETREKVRNGIILVLATLLGLVIAGFGALYQYLRNGVPAQLPAAPALAAPAAVAPPAAAPPVRGGPEPSATRPPPRERISVSARLERQVARELRAVSGWSAVPARAGALLAAEARERARAAQARALAPPPATPPTSTPALSRGSFSPPAASPPPPSPSPSPPPAAPPAAPPPPADPICSGPDAEFGLSPC